MRAHAQQSAAWLSSIGNPWARGVRCVCRSRQSYSPSSNCSGRARHKVARVCAAKDSGGSAAGPGKADFSAYWSLKFREFFSKRRQYLEQAAKRKEPPEILKKLDAQIEFLQDRIQELQVLDREVDTEVMLRYQQQLQSVLQQLDDMLSAGKEPSSSEVAAKLKEAERLLPQSGLGYSLGDPLPSQLLQNDVERAREQLHSTQSKVLTLTPLQLRAAIKALVMLPFTLPAALYRSWRATFESQRYQNFLMAEGERMWYWRNRMENERWFWEEFMMQRMVVPALWTICYLAVVPNNLIWAVLVPFVMISWQNGQVPHPGNMEWWLIMYFGLYGKCWDQVLALVSMVFQWW